MPLEALPTELLQDIFQYAGLRDFPLQLELLLISKWWCMTAYTVAFEHFKLSPFKNSQLCDRPALLELLKSKTKSIEVDLCNVKAEPSSLSNSPNARRVQIYVREVPSTVNIQYFIRLLQSCHTLRSFTIRAGLNRPAGRSPCGSIVVDAAKLNTIPSAPLFGLTTVIIDVQHNLSTGYDTATRRIQTPLRLQTCLNIVAHLLTLYRLCVRLPTVCPRAVDLGSWSKEVPLRELALNVTKLTTLDRRSWDEDAGACPYWFSRNGDHTEDMTAAVHELMRHAPRLELARMIKTSSFTVTAGIPGMHVAWDFWTESEALIPRYADWTENVPLKHTTFSEEDMGLAWKKKYSWLPEKRGYQGWSD